MKQKFIDKVVLDLIEKNTDFSNTTIIVPGKRPILFFTKAFKVYYQKGILPSFLSVEEFLQNVAELELLPIVKQWILSYKIYKKQIQEPEDFQSFIKWIPTLLNDFNDIDAALAEPNNVFQYLISTERINQWDLSPNFDIENNELIQKHLLFWEIAKDLYDSINQEFQKKGVGYSGLILRTAANKIDEFKKTNKQNYIFVGFNALTTAEDYIIDALEKENQAKTYWQSDSYYLENKENEAGLFLRRYQKKRESFNWILEDYKLEKNIEVIALPKQVGQAKYVNQILNKLPETELKDTALVLGDETLLSTVINSLPESLKNINITMGLPLKQLPIAQFFLDLFELQINRVKLSNGEKYYYKDILKCLNQSFFIQNEKHKKTVQKSIHLIKQNNQIFISPFEIQEKLKNTFFEKIFIVENSVLEFINHIVELIESIGKSVENEQNNILKESLFRFYTLFNSLNQELKENQLEINFKTAKFLFINLLQKETISFIGEPLQGLQIIGMLESRLLDYKNVILCGVNEDILPFGSSDNSFVPFEIRKSFKLNTYTEKDAIFAYHFYRLLQYADNVYLLYNSDTEGLSSGEKSRFIRQLELELPYKVNHVKVSQQFSGFSISEIEIPKSEIVMERLKNWTKKGISASSLNSYIRNPIQFYEQQVLNVNRPDEIEESAGSLTLGNIVHNSLEELYKPFVNQNLVVEQLKKIKKESSDLVTQKFKQEFGNSEFNKGRNLIALNVAIKMVENLIEKDIQTSKNNEVIIRGLEQKFTLPYQTEQNDNLLLKGYIDRIDEVNGITRIIDYKTGGFNENALKVTERNLPLVFTDEKRSMSLQLLFYSILYLESSPRDSAQFGIYPLRFTQKPLMNLEWEKNTLINQSEIQKFKPFFNDLIDEILNPETSFTEIE